MSLRMQHPTKPVYRLPAEWEPHAATWLSWPHNTDTWPGDTLEQVYAHFAQIVAVLAHSETVHINVNDAAMETMARQYLASQSIQGDIRLHQFATNDAWCRDYGAILLTRHQGDVPGCAAVDWGYNAWGNKFPPCDQDARIATRMADELNIPRFVCDLIVEGGAIDGNGAGLLLTTESCLLNANRNPGYSRAQVEELLCAMLGVQHILWLGEGFVDDETDGHVDNIARFVAADTVVAVVEENPDDPNYAIFQANLGRLQAMRDLNGQPLRIVPLPTPKPLFRDGLRLPLSYANFYIANRSVLMPAFNQPTDQAARAILQSLFPDREVVAIDCTAIIVGGGAIHCLTQPQPALCQNVDAVS